MQRPASAFRSLIDRIQVAAPDSIWTVPTMCKIKIDAKLSRKDHQGGFDWFLCFAGSFGINNSPSKLIKFFMFFGRCCEHNRAFRATMHQFHSQSHFYHCQRIQMEIQCRVACFLSLSLSTKKNAACFYSCKYFWSLSHPRAFRPWIFSISNQLHKHKIGLKLQTQLNRFNNEPHSHCVHVSMRLTENADYVRFRMENCSQHETAWAKARASERDSSAVRS